MPKKTESTGTGLESYVAKLMGNGSNRTSVTEDEIQVALKDIDVSDEQLNAVYSALRNSGIQIISASGNDDAPMDVDDDDNDTDTDDFDDDDEHEHEHHHHDHDEHDHDHDEHEHHHDHDGHCCCGHHHHDHHADEVFTSWGVETARKFTKAEVEHALTELDTGNYGMILRSKGIVDGGADGWLEFDYVPGEWEVRARGADVGGKLVVIGSKLNETAIAQLFGC